jgi:hypothetical protein
MDVQNWIRRRVWNRRRLWPSEFSSTLFLKLQRCQPVGGLVIAHYLTNPDERPDHVFRHECKFRTDTQGDFETRRWAVEKITPDQDAMLERRPGGPPQEHLVVLTDAVGNVLLQDYCSAERATLLMHAAGLPAVDDERRIG